MKTKKPSIGLQDKGGGRNNSDREQDRVRERGGTEEGAGQKNRAGERQGEGQRKKRE